MSDLQGKIQYFMQQLAEIKKVKADLTFKEGKYNEELLKWLKEQGLPEQFNLIELVNHFVGKQH